MICFPLDNTGYVATALGAWFATRTRGVFANDGHYAVTSNDDMTVTVGPGLAWLKAGEYWGVVALESAAQTLTFETADGSLPRIDTVCVRLDKNQALSEIVVKKGGYSPQPPAIPPVVRDLNYDEIYVAAVTVRAGATAITQADIADLRLNETYCGVMRDGVTGIPTQQLYDAWWTWFSGLKLSAEQQARDFTEWIDRFMSLNETELQEWLTHFKDSGTASLDSWFQGFTNASESEFHAWFDSLKDALDGDQAANLYNLIDSHMRQSIVYNENGVHGLRYYQESLQVFVDGDWITVSGGAVQKGYSWARIDSLDQSWEEFDAAGLTWKQLDARME